MRTKSGRLIEKTILVSKEEYEELKRIEREGGDPASILNKYMSKDEKVQGWKKVEPPSKPMKVVKTMVRTKSGRLVRALSFCSLICYKKLFFIKRMTVFV